MPRWRALPEELDPQVREFANQLRRLVDRSGLSIAAVADRTGYSKTSWDRYLNGRLLAPKRAIVTLAEVTGTNPMHLTTMWELAERAWSRSEMRHDMTMEAIRISQARAALGEFGPNPVKGKNGKGRSGAPATAASASSAPSASPQATASPPSSAKPYTPDAYTPDAYAPGSHAPGSYGPGGAASGAGPRSAAVGGGGGRGPVAAPPGPGGGGPAGPSGSPDRQRQRRRLTMFLAGVVGALVVVAAAVFLTDFGGEEDPVAKPPATPSVDPDLPAGVDCSGKDCTGEDPELNGCGGELAKTTTRATVGTTLVEVRYSKTCGAAWARITQAAPGDEVQIAGSDAKAEERVEVDKDTDAYTPMVAVKDAAEAKACATLKSGAKGCTTDEAPTAP